MHESRKTQYHNQWKLINWRWSFSKIKKMKQNLIIFSSWQPAWVMTGCNSRYSIKWNRIGLFLIKWQVIPSVHWRLGTTLFVKYACHCIIAFITDFSFCFFFSFLQKKSNIEELCPKQAKIIHKFFVSKKCFYWSLTWNVLNVGNFVAVSHQLKPISA